ncbi:hypothetical protein P8C59_000993 [Phyllachora maydis]|uniref:Uncharacterized protein n=1 Tax=Phyllachora maydis TaxID=1825666 RepID=A0AAD9HYM1_9PEZI|nr:hypothetical protein P8C59_000993 [Phyllachora maydis]
MSVQFSLRHLARQSAAANSLARPLATATTATTTTTTTTTTTATTTTTTSATTPSVHQRRTLHTTAPRLLFGFFRRRSKGDDNHKDELTKELTGSQVDRQRLLGKLQEARVDDSTSIFADDLARARTQRPPPSAAAGPLGSADQASAARRARRPDDGVHTVDGGSVAPAALARALDPDPSSRARWQRRALIRRIARVGTNPFSREPPAARLARTERQLVSRSAWLPTSIKKLGPLARQIAGKTVAEALLQMRFSPKRMAAEVGFQLRQARDMAAVARGMGLGEAKGELLGPDRAVEICTKEGKRLRIEDPTRLYVDQAWVNRGPARGFRSNYRARGKRDVMVKPSTSIAIVLKEEKTRIREHQEREEKQRRRKPWVHLPDRPIAGQRPYYAW